MPRVCHVCSHPDKDAIDRAIVRGEAQRRVAALYRLSPDSVLKHKARHLPEGLTKARVIEEATQADALLAELLSLRDRLYSLLDQAEAASNRRDAVAAHRELRSNIELFSEIAGRLDRRPQVTLWLSPEWLTLQATLLTVLARFPDARLAVIDALTALEAGHTAPDPNGTLN